MEEAEGGRPAKRPAAAAGGDGAGPSGTGGSVPEPAAADYTRLTLLPHTIKELQTILKAWNLPVCVQWACWLGSWQEGLGSRPEAGEHATATTATGRRAGRGAATPVWLPVSCPVGCPPLPCPAPKKHQFAACHHHHPPQVSGKKDDLIQRILDHQRNARGG